MEAIKKHLHEQFPVEKFRQPFKHIHNGLIDVFVDEVIKALPENMTVNETGQLVFSGSPKEGFEKFVEDSQTDLDREQQPSLESVVKELAKTPQWKAFF